MQIHFYFSFVCICFCSHESVAVISTGHQEVGYVFIGYFMQPLANKDSFQVAIVVENLFACS